MRWYIIRTLLLKEVHRQVADRGGIFLAIVLVVAALVLSIFGKNGPKIGYLFTEVKLWHVDYWESSTLIAHLKNNRPSDVKVNFRSVPNHNMPVDDVGNVVYPESTVAVQVRPLDQDHQGRPRYLIQFWYHGDDSRVVVPLADWFWKETLEHFQDTPLRIATAEDQMVYPQGSARIQVAPVQPEKTDKIGRPYYQLLFWRPVTEGVAPAPGVEFEEERSALQGGIDAGTMVATVLMMFALFLFCVYLLPSFTCEERERGVLLAQVLSPATTDEILAAKFLFYPVLGMGLAVLQAGLYSPIALLRPFFWLVLFTFALGYLSVGLTIASLARTQRKASMGALCYLLIVTLALFITEQFGLPSVRFVALEYSFPRLASAAMQGSIFWFHWLNLAGAFVLTCLWTLLASRLFQRRGWQ